MTRDNLEDDCPSQDYEPGSPAGDTKQGCFGDGHYLCKQCTHYREDFFRLGQEYIDYVIGYVGSLPTLHVL